MNKNKSIQQFFSFVKKEFYHIFRDVRTMVILLGMPVAQIIIFGFALTNEVKNSKVAILDFSKSDISASIAKKIDASQYFDVETYLNSYDEIEKTFRHSKIKLAIIFPSNFENDLKHTNKATVQFIADASDPNVANTITNYASSIFNDFIKNTNPLFQLPYTIKPEIRMLYNPQQKGAYNFVPGVMAMVLMLVCALMTAITIVKEKELGTMEILLVSPMKPLMVVIAKAVPYLLLSLINITTILLLSVFVLEVPINGSLVLLGAESILFAIVSLSLGLLISSSTGSQQTAMFITLVGMFLPTVMFSGFLFPVENMPLPLQVISNIIPAKWYYYIVKNVMIKGSGFDKVWKETLILTGMMLFFVTVAIKKFKIRLA